MVFLGFENREVDKWTPGDMSPHFRERRAQRCCTWQAARVRKRHPGRAVWIPASPSRDIDLQLIKGKCSLDAEVIKLNQKLEVNLKIMYAFMVSIFIYSLLLESEESQSRHNSPLPAYPVLSVQALPLTFLHYVCCVAELQLLWESSFKILMHGFLESLQQI